MSRQLPATITADKSPDWLPAGWIAQSTVLKSGREIRSYTNLKTGQKFSTKDDVLQHIEMEKIREIRYSETEKAKHGGQTIKIPQWLPDNWTLEERMGSSGNVYKVYTNLSTGYKCYNKPAVLRCLGYTEHESSDQKELILTTNEHPKWLPDNWIMEVKTTRSGKHKIYIDLVSGCKCHSKAEVTRYLDTLKIEASTKESEETGTSENTIAYERPGLPANPKMKLRTRKRGLTKEKQIEPPLPPARRRKLRSRGIRRQLFVDEDTGCSGDDALSEAEASTDEIHDEVDSSDVELIVSHLPDCLAEEYLHDVVVEFDAQTKETVGITSSSGAEVNVGCLGALTYVGADSLPEKDLNESRTEKIDATNIGLASSGLKNGKGDLLMHVSDSAKDDIFQELGCKSKKPLKVQALQEEQQCPEERTNVSSQMLFFPFKVTPTDTDHVLAFDTTTAPLSAEDLGNTFELASKSCADNPRGKSIRGSKMQKKSIGTSLSQKTKEKGAEIPCRSTEQPEKPKKPNKLQGEISNRATSDKASVSMDRNECRGPNGSASEAYWPPDIACKNPSRTGTSAGEGSSRNNRGPARQQMDHWPDLCAEFVFESLTSSPRNEDDSVIRRYLEEHVTADVSLPLPDFGLPSFANIKLSSV